MRDQPPVEVSVQGRGDRPCRHGEITEAHELGRRVGRDLDVAGLQALGKTAVRAGKVDRDDLDDGGAQHFVNVIKSIRKRSPTTTIEVLTPDFLRKDGALEKVVEAKPDVFNHNLETVPALYLAVRPGARYFHSLRLLQRVKELDRQMFTKSGIMVGLGETREQVLQVMDDMRSADITDSATLPVVGAEEGGVSYLVRSEPAATDMLNAFVAGQPLPVQ